jgi:hypothetical protein
MTTSVGQAILGMLESDLDTVAAPQVITLLQNLATHKGNKIAQGADVVQFVATAPAAGLTLEAEVEAQLLQLGVRWIQSEVAKAPAAPSGTAGGGSPA